MDQHTWTDPLCGECRAFPSTAGGILGAMAREVVRLAQREADLDASIESQRASNATAAESQALRIAELEADLETVRGDREYLAERVRELEDAFVIADYDTHIERIKGLEFDLAAAKRANEILGAKVNRLEGEAVGLRQKDAAWDKREKAHADLESRLTATQGLLASSERALIEARHQRAIETARADSLNDALIGSRQESDRRLEAFRLADREAAARRKQIAALEADLRELRQKREMEAPSAVESRLRDAIEDGIAHVERARHVSLGVGIQMPADQRLPLITDQLDLAHEALSKAGAGKAPPHVDVAPVGLAKRVTALEADLRFIMAHAAVALAHTGKE